MGDLGTETAVELLDRGEGWARYSATLHQAWEIWGPNGGYLASVALRAAGAESRFDRPASFSCHYLGVAGFEPVELLVSSLRSAKTAASSRVELTQAGRPILEATVWSTGEVDGLVHDHSSVLDPGVPPPEDVPDLADLLSAEELEAGPPFGFWNNFDVKPIGFQREFPDEPEPRWQEWIRFKPRPTFSDPWLDACRSLVLIDVQSWPAAGRAHRPGHGFIAPSLDLYVAFHDPQPESEWLLADGYGAVARDGLMGWSGRLWSEERRLVASGMGQLLCRRVPNPSA